jgi:hypothetical protein
MSVAVGGHMSETFSAHFDGRVIIPDQPVSLPIGQKLQLRVEVTTDQPNQFADLAQFAADLPNSPGDLSTQHDHYLYGTTKK